MKRKKGITRSMKRKATQRRQAELDRSFSDDQKFDFSRELAGKYVRGRR